MAIRIKFEIEVDSPAEVAELLLQLPGLARAIPQDKAPAVIAGNLDQKARDKADRSVRFELYKANGGKLTFLGWAHSGEPEDPQGEQWAGPSDQAPRGLQVVK